MESGKFSQAAAPWAVKDWERSFLTDDQLEASRSKAEVIASIPNTSESPRGPSQQDTSRGYARAFPRRQPLDQHQACPQDVQDKLARRPVHDELLPAYAHSVRETHRS